ncbi:beta-ketoacyl-ACP synthase [Verminephrobacter aporrectodeae subsp. tuberculatae]|uniref:Beta-ketoacyl-ACP synthase n=1 Tax=Verminephrobacter aporrectodeae subsp. tuberculatae TaxID=1110392 RepID=A0ABT3KRR9_9BURK|nr:beta-ketoacyl-ACP synthase [Verminephrobacter aporrectodeae]MCW5220041.1 beta-ketoacyl-ACP synthase [Verminephrobacter aporrectodeae subsp. tuberculatae]MCW5289329.1 beta-ketoacyl-ACP synthase [Verminephrobacter aporrectodeae subsp. tuberculatae]MCW5321006.1 beta-ketoacyl-ACP synthase [Verminephrobacter aporrectodeae subsp. tuberculatae]MCW8198930.1 beta-ketoacyl-ACP synthase [Verminephrobacter aporrectodeae subsp. tuberculatae]
MKRVVITGVGALSPLGHDWPTVRARLRAERNAVEYLREWDEYEGLNTRLGARVAPFDIPARYNRKVTRSMGRVAIMATLTGEMALADAGLTGDALVTSGNMGISYGSSLGSPAAMGDFSNMIARKTTEGINANTYIRLMSHSAAVNMGVFLGVTGRIIPTSSACTAGSQGVGYAFEAIQSGRQIAMLAGGAEELDATDAAVFDTLFATSVNNDKPQLSPRPFDAERDGLVLGEGACTLVLEELAHARARGARILAEIIGFGTNSDGTHVTQPNPRTMAQAMRLALANAGLPPEAIGYINAHGTATAHGDVAESQGTHEVFGDRTPISSLKSYMGHTLGACGALEVWMSLEMMRDDWFAPTINLRHVDPNCCALDYVREGGRTLQTDIVMSNNFAFGGINTSLIMRRWSES